MGATTGLGTGGSISTVEMVASTKECGVKWALLPPTFGVSTNSASG